MKSADSMTSSGFCCDGGCDNVNNMISRRSFVAASALASVSLRAAAKKIPVGLEMYSVRDELMKDLPGTVRAVAKMGYEVMEFYAPYFQWTTDYAKDVRKQLTIWECAATRRITTRSRSRRMASSTPSR